jgi:transcriptional regulator of arginine metabolism
VPTAPDIRDKRRQAILDIVSSQSVNRQTELVKLLQADGYEATQSSVSRDLSELGITKLADGYAQLQTSNALPAVELPAGYVREILTAGNNLTVIKTATGAAQRVALFLDRSNWPEVVGTVSGDDTIFVATRDGREQKLLLGRIRSNLDM